jgi:hypothetical protein
MNDALTVGLAAGFVSTLLVVGLPRCSCCCFWRGCCCCCCCCCRCREMRTLLRRYPDFPDMRAALAAAQWAAGREGDAETNWQRVEDPRWVIGHGQLGCAVLCGRGMSPYGVVLVTSVVQHSFDVAGRPPQPGQQLQPHSRGQLVDSACFGVGPPALLLVLVPCCCAGTRLSCWQPV